MNKETAIELLQKLVDYYTSNKATWEAKNYKEAQAREDFIDVFFEVLGWQISGIPSGLSPEERDVLVEYSLKDGTTKSLDYIFKIRNRHQFIVEAKKPSEDISNPKHIFQAKSYGFLSKIPFVILTNFKEIRIYDITTKPNRNQINEDLVFSCSYEEYLDNFEFLWSNFGKTAVEQKSLIKLYTERRNELDIDLDATDYSYISKKGELLLDRIFLNDLEDIRTTVAQGIINSSSQSYNDKELNEITQRLLDVILFIRFLEDNEIEDVEHLRNLITSGESFMPGLLQLCINLNSKYNGLLFHEYSPFSSVEIDDELIRSTVLRLYYPESPYNFSKISIEILGRIFEQYLGKKLEQDGDQVSLVIKEDVQKAGGIFYTPEYIVEKILDETLISEDTDFSLVGNTEGVLSRIMDCSCGSGVFLIKSFKKLIHYLEQDSDRLNEGDYFVDSLGRTTMTMESKKKVLKSNIFGIDIDPQAVEITKMSLYFTMLEKYAEDNSLRPLLPSLDENISCGNSILGMDFFDRYEGAATEVVNRLNPFSWNDVGPQEFDLIVGNPPYLRIQLLEELYPIEYHSYLKSTYSFAFGNYDISLLFVEKGIEHLSANGKLGFILPNTGLKSKYGEEFRERLANDRIVKKIIHFNDYQIFDNSLTYTCLLFLEKGNQEDNFDFVSIANIHEDVIDESAATVVSKNDIGREPWFFSTSSLQTDFIAAISANSFALQELPNLDKIFVGLQPSVNSVYLLELTGENTDTYTCFSKALNREVELEKGLIKPMVKGSRNIFRYHVNTNKCLLFPYENDVEAGSSVLIDQEVLERDYPLTWEYLELCRPTLSMKEALRGDDFYKFIYKKNHHLFDNPKILLPSLCLGSRFTYDREGQYYFTGSGEGGGGGYGLLLNDTESNYNYGFLLGLLNSSVISSLIEIRGKNKSGGYKGIDRTFIHAIPIPNLSTQDKIDTAELIGRKALRLHELYQEEKTIAVTRFINRLDSEINELVLGLYGISNPELIGFIQDNSN